MLKHSAVKFAVHCVALGLARAAARSSTQALVYTEWNGMAANHCCTVLNGRSTVRYSGEALRSKSALLLEILADTVRSCSLCSQFRLSVALSGLVPSATATATAESPPVCLCGSLCCDRPHTPIGSIRHQLRLLCSQCATVATPHPFAFAAAVPVVDYSPVEYPEAFSQRFRSSTIPYACCCVQSSQCALSHGCAGARSQIQ